MGPTAALLNPDKRIDCIGFFCPIPVLRAREAMRTMGAGQILEILADDPAAEADMRAWANRSGHELIGLTCSGAVRHFLLRKAR